MMSSNQFQPSQGSQKPNIKAPAVAERLNTGMRSNSSLNPDSAPWTPALVPEGMPPVSQQAPHGFHNSYNLHHSVSHITITISAVQSIN